MVDGLDERRLLAQMDEIDRLNAKLQGHHAAQGHRGGNPRGRPPGSARHASWSSSTS
ncbi:MAG: hypothetical protein MZU95_10780 [Desulfomicrobium escambiense]|nr:hypothetical protein [Desulfomicrobium escambiense]